MTDRDADLARTVASEGKEAPIATATCEMGKLFLLPDRLRFRGSPLQDRLGRPQSDQEIDLRGVTAIEWQAPSFLRMGRLGLVLEPGGEGPRKTVAFAFQRWERRAFEAFRSELERAVEEARARPAEVGSGGAAGGPPAIAAGSPPSGIDVPEQIRRLGQLRDDGLITADEFEAKKRDLLARM